MRFHKFVPALLIFAAVSGAAAGSVSFTASDFPARQTASEPGSTLRFLKLDASGTPPVLTLAEPLAGEFTVSCLIRLDAYPDNGREGFTETAPGTIAMLTGGPGDGEAIIRIYGKKAQLHYHGGAGKGVLTTAAFVLPLHEWLLLTLVRERNSLRLYVDGIPAGTAGIAPQPGSFSRLTVGCGVKPGRRFRGDLAAVTLHNHALTPAEVRSAFHATGFVSHVKRDIDRRPLMLRYPVLTTAPDALQPIAGPPARTAEIVPWNGPDAHDLLVSGEPVFGHRVMLYRNLSFSKDGSPVYDSGISIGLKGRDFKRLPRPDGSFDLLCSGDETPYGAGTLVFYRNTGRSGAPEFAAPAPLTVGGAPLSESLPGMSVSGWNTGDLDGDGVPDLLLVTVRPGDWDRYRPDGVSFWDNTPNENQGPGRGYDFSGKWLGEQSRYFLHWAKGEYAAGEMPRFGTPRGLDFRTAGFPLQLKSYPPGPYPALCRSNGDNLLVVSGDVDRLWTFRLKPQGGTFLAEPLRELPRSQYSYWNNSLRAHDFDGDGNDDLIMAGNPGRIVLLRNDGRGNFREFTAYQSGGPVASDTLANPARGDWDGDGLPDLITGDASGYLTYRPGTSDPLVYGAPVFLRENGRIFHRTAGTTGSIQGPQEARWGYLQPTLGDWDGDGRNEIITNDIKGELLLLTPAGDPAEVNAAPFTLNGKPLPAAWRVRPAILPAKYNFMGKGVPVLLYLDYDGDLAAAVPVRTGSAEIAESVKLRDVQGNPVRLCGIRGHWGRAKLAVADFDRDGRWDLVWGHNASVYRDIWPDRANLPAGATLAFSRNTGSNAEPRFVAAREIVAKDGTRFNFRIHNSSLFPTDLDGDGITDFLVGAEDGKIYYFYGKNLKLKD